jgi:hypothetical protein
VCLSLEVAAAAVTLQQQQKQQSRVWWPAGSWYRALRKSTTVLHMIIIAHEACQRVAMAVYTFGSVNLRAALHANYCGCSCCCRRLLLLSLPAACRRRESSP